MIKWASLPQKSLQILIPLWLELNHKIANSNMNIKVRYLIVQVSKVVQSCLTVCDPMDCSLPRSSVHGIFQARVLEWVAIPSPGDLSDPGIEPMSPVLQADSLPTELGEKPYSQSILPPKVVVF